MIVLLDKPLELAKERQIVVYLNGEKRYFECTPSDLEDLIVGHLVSEGLVGDHRSIKIEQKSPETFYVEFQARYEEQKTKLTAKKKYSVEELRRYLSLLDIEEYKKTHGYHVAAVIGEKLHLRYDVGRHNAVEKAIGSAYLNNEDPEGCFLVLSGRITTSITRKCFNAKIPLIVSKAAIVDSAIEFCEKKSLSAISFLSNVAVIGSAIEIV
ncbi:MAG: formate dehydrogenase accessory sulfurtransferase FdhD [Archaeoglobales archaeon]|nr:formate dehydrogenase accessory sulfurtransferase FdhD [Archaeoglobales archaeon]